HRSGDLPVQHAVCRRNGRVSGADVAGTRRPDADGRLAAGGTDMSAATLRRIVFLLVALFLAGPLIVVAGVSVNEKQSLIFPPEGFSFAWYGQIFTDPGWRSALVNSLTLAAASAALAVIIAMPLAWFLWRRVAPWANVFRLLGIAPVILPPVIPALGFLSFWAPIGSYGQGCTAMVSHAIFFVTLPLVT